MDRWADRLITRRQDRQIDRRMDSRRDEAARYIEGRRSAGFI